MQSRTSFRPDAHYLLIIEAPEPRFTTMTKLIAALIATAAFAMVMATTTSASAICC